MFLSRFHFKAVMLSNFKLIHGFNGFILLVSVKIFKSRLISGGTKKTSKTEIKTDKYIGR